MLCCHLGAAGNPASFAWGTGADERSRQYAKWVAESPRPMVNLVLRYGQSRRSDRNSDGVRQFLLHGCFNFLGGALDDLANLLDLLFVVYVGGCRLVRRASQLLERL